MQNNDSVGDYFATAAGAVIAVFALFGLCLWVVYKLFGLLFKLALWLTGVRWVSRMLKRQVQEYWTWRNSADWKIQLYERQVEREWEYVRRDVPWDQLRPGFRPLKTRLVGWFYNQSFPAWVRFRLMAKPAKPRRRQEVL